MSICVLDASLAIEFVTAQPMPPGLDAVFVRIEQHGAVVPAVWHWEFANALLRRERRVGLPGVVTAAALATVLALPIETEDEPAAPAAARLLPLARQAGLTLFDTFYLDLAQRAGLPLATLDGGLASAATRRGVALLPLTP